MRLVGGAEIQNMWQIKIRSEGSQAHIRSPSLRFQYPEERRRHKFWLYKPVEIEAVEDRNCLNPRQFLLKDPCTDLSALAPSELGCKGSQLKGIRVIWGETELSGMRVRAGGGSFLPYRSAGRGHRSFSETSLNRASEPACICHIWYFINLSLFAPPWWFPGPTQL